MKIFVELILHAFVTAENFIPFTKAKHEYG